MADKNPSPQPSGGDKARQPNSVTNPPKPDTGDSDRPAERPGQNTEKAKHDHK